MRNESLLQTLRQQYQPILPSILRNLQNISLSKGGKTSPSKDIAELRQLFPKTFGQPLVKGKEGSKRPSKQLRVGVVFSGGQAAGGHNVIAGLFDSLKSLNAGSQL